MKKRIALYIPDSTSGIYLPLLWASCKSYYEAHGLRPNDYEWIHPRINYEFDTDKLKEQLLKEKPDVFGISMYIWNDVQCLEIAKWVKEQFPKCIVISGGPQQYFKHEADWFQKYSFLDASLDGGEYGELTIADILDNLTEDNTIDWNLVREVVYPSKNRKMMLKSKKTTPKRDFAWDYSPYDLQQDTILECAREISQFQNTNLVYGKLETTRGCPYSCAFCDWGGGIGSKVIIKSVENAKKDIDILEQANCSFVFLCDANFGILGERDIEIMEYMAERKQANPNFFHLYFGGFAKSDRHSEHIKRILDLDAQNNLTWDLSYKASVQSIHKDVLDNIRRSDISFDKHIELAKHLKKNYNFSTYAECISGLPGITPDKWYEEINVFTRHNMDICLYHWHLLPETPSYDYKYRQQMGIGTVNKYNNLQTNNSTLRKSEVVVESFSYTKDDYKEMWLAFAVQRGFWTTGIIDNTLKKIMSTSNIGYGDFVKKVVRELFRDEQAAGEYLTRYVQRVDRQFARYFDPDSKVSHLSLDFEHVVAPFQSSFMLTIYYYFDEFKQNFKDWLLKEFPYLNEKELDKELNSVITSKTKFKIKRRGLQFSNYSNSLLSQFKKYEETKLVDFLVTQMETYTKTSFLRGRTIGL